MFLDKDKMLAVAEDYYRLLGDGLSQFAGRYLAENAHMVSNQFVTFDRNTAVAALQIHHTAVSDLSVKFAFVERNKVGTLSLSHTAVDSSGRTHNAETILFMRINPETGWTEIYRQYTNMQGVTDDNQRSA